MRRRARAIHLARARESNLRLRLANGALRKWPKKLRHARLILRRELKLSEEVARSLLIESASNALQCAKAIDRRAGQIAISDVQNSLQSGFGRLSRCAGRAPAGLRHLLDEETSRVLVSDEAIDTETVEAILEAAKAAFVQFDGEESSRAAIRVLCGESTAGELTVALKAEYGGLGAEFRSCCEQALSSLKEEGATTAAAIFSSLAAALVAERKSSPIQVHDLITDYTGELAQLWRSARQHPGRGRDPGDPLYKTRFHRFADLVLATFVEPGSMRHEGAAKIEKKSNAIRARHDGLPDEVRSAVRPALRRSDREWLVSEDHIKKSALKPIQKTGLDTP